MTGIGMSSLYGMYHRDTTTTINSLTPRAVTWRRVEAKATKDPNIVDLAKLIQAEPPENKLSWPEKLRPYFQVCADLSTQGSVIRYKERIVILASLRAEVLDVLHSGQGGVSSMVSRFPRSVCWPGLQIRLKKAYSVQVM